ncbi:L,D-transpeptidase [[Pseudomonas] carboxydohydrogena]|uniref:L,D-transpeptidase n=1 Tax=Afipia carboxydohydrogena TaxID=290 RepID=A0ABY8BQN6_AFICR|nr:L,D-transpeptidase [[Pseudomonas] carboxydohydrogena]WEF51224.1 L,D-transpeptidase [[Pseudomonas] carboxydohydrogena]
MSAKIRLALVAAACLTGMSYPAFAQSAGPQVYYASQPESAPQQVAYRQPANNNMGGGFIQFLFGGGEQAAPVYQQQEPYDPRQRGYGYQQERAVEAAQPGFDPRYEKQVVDYNGKEAPGTLVIDTPNKFLYLVQGNGRALRYGVGVGKPGFMWSGVKTISAKREWPDWTPPAEMIKRRPDLPRHMEGGPENPLGARAMYLGSTLYRIHGSNEPWTIGTNVSSGCIRMRNEDVIDLYGRVKVGTRVVVL